MIAIGAFGPQLIDKKIKFRMFLAFFFLMFAIIKVLRSQKINSSIGLIILKYFDDAYNLEDGKLISIVSFCLHNAYSLWCAAQFLV